MTTNMQDSFVFTSRISPEIRRSKALLGTKKPVGCLLARQHIQISKPGGRPPRAQASVCGLYSGRYMQISREVDAVSSLSSSSRRSSASWVVQSHRDHGSGGQRDREVWDDDGNDDDEVQSNEEKEKENEAGAAWEHMEELLQEEHSHDFQTQNSTVPGSSTPPYPASMVASESGLTGLGRLLKQLLPGPFLHIAAFSFPISGLVAIYGQTLVNQLAMIGIDIPHFLLMLNFQGMHVHHLLQVVLSVAPSWAAHMLVDASAWALGVDPAASAAVWWAAALPAVLSFAGVLFGFLLMPAADLLCGWDSTSMSEEDARKARRKAGYRVVLCMYVPLQLSMLLWALMTVAAGVPMLQLIGITLSVGVTQGVAINAAHELLHSPHALDRMFSQALLVPVFYMHWGCSHLAHHVQVATDRDPSSARKGESFWSFLPRSIIGNVKDADRIERQRLRRFKLPFWSLQNRWCIWGGVPLATVCLIASLFGTTPVIFYLIQGFVGVCMLEVVNYLEHYGLERQQLRNGGYEKCSIQHSWNTDWFLSNAILFQLQRHTDHHMHAVRPYYALRSIKDAPQLPASYPAMMLLATIPPLWFYVMNPLVDKYNQRMKAEVVVEQAEDPPLN